MWVLEQCFPRGERITDFIGDRELLAVKLALKDRLEGADLEYIQQAKRLNPRQARWSQYFNRFEFILSYRPGTKNLTPDALSQVYANSKQEDPITPIITSSKILAPVRWEHENTIRQVQVREPDPGGGPTNCLLVPKSVRSQVLQWSHSSRLTCHPGTIRTLEFLQRRFWWPTIKEDTKSFVTACPTCNQGKVSHRSPQDLLHPRSITRRPWSHLSVDFITGLPPSKGNTTIMVIVDRFSKAGRFIPLPKLPTA